MTSASMGMAVQEITRAPWFDAMLTAGRRVHYPAGQTFHHAGAPLAHVSIILSGQVELWHIAESGQEVWLGTCTRGDVIGTAQLIPQSLGAFDMTALTNVALLTLSREGFDDFARKHPEFATVMMGRVARLVEQGRNALVRAQTLPARGRIECELMRLSEPVGIDPSKRIIRPSPVFADMARRAGTTRETVSRTVNAMCKSGVLERQPGALLVIDADGLG